MSMVSGMQRNSGMNEEKYMSNFNSGNRVINIQSQDCVSVALKQTLTAIQNNLICFLRSLGSRLNIRLEVFGFLFYSGNAAENPQVSIITRNQQAITRAKTEKKPNQKPPKSVFSTQRKPPLSHLERFLLERGQGGWHCGTGPAAAPGLIQHLPHTPTLHIKNLKRCIKDDSCSFSNLSIFILKPLGLEVI